MKNWDFKYKWSIFLLLLIVSCSDSKDNSFLESDSNVISIATDENLMSFDFYSNNVFSKFIKDLICEPIFYLNPTSNKVTSSVIASYKWIHESEIELIIQPAVYFHNNPKYKLYKERNITPEDIIHSILLQKKNSIYPEVREFLETFDKLTPKDKSSLIISLNKSVDPHDFLLEFASIEIPVISSDVEQVNSLNDVVGNGLYSLDVVSENQIRLKLFKGYAKIKSFSFENKELPRGYIINLGVSNTNQLKFFKEESVDGVLTSSVSLFSKSVDQMKHTIGSLIIRKEDELHIAAFNFEQSLTANYSNIEYIKKLIDPTEYNQVYFNNQMNAFYTIYDVDDYQANTVSTLTIGFDCDSKFKNYVLTKFYDKDIHIQQDGTPDLIIYKLMTPTNNIQIINYYIYKMYISKGLINDEKVAREASVKLFQPVKYLLFNRQVKFRNDAFETRNDFSVLFK